MYNLRDIEGNIYVYSSARDSFVFVFKRDIEGNIYVYSSATDHVVFEQTWQVIRVFHFKGCVVCWGKGDVEGNIYVYSSA